MSEKIVGHKTFWSKERGYYHAPLGESEATDLMGRLRESADRRASQMPDEQSAINALFDAWLRLKELGWREAIYCPKDGSMFKAIEAGSTGIHDCNYQGEWPTGSWWAYWDGDCGPSHPILWKPES